MLPYVVVAGGPSVSISDVRTIGMARAAGRCRVIAVNDAIYPCWFADHLHACDAKWWSENYGVAGYRGVKTSVEPVAYDDVAILKNTGLHGYDQRVGCIRTGGNSGYQAVHIAAQAGAKKIILLGVDYTDDGARSHWFGMHKVSMDRQSDVVHWRTMLRDLTNVLNAMGIAVLNAGSRSTLTWLPRTEITHEL